MTTVEENIKCLSMFIAELYFMKREYDNLLFYLDDNITWIGTGKNEICLNKEEALKFFAKEIDVFDGSFEITDRWFEAKQVTNDVCNVMAVIKIKLDTDAAILPFDILRFSVVWRRTKKDNLWKIVHLHNSIPDGGIGEDTYFNLSIAESNYQVVRDSIRKASSIDTLTSINNEKGFEYDVEQLLKRYPDNTYAIIKFGIKNFRFVNRKHSFSTGDEVLKNIAKNLAKSLMAEETCGRIEKDNFAMLYKIEDKKSLEKRMMKVREQLIDKPLYRKLNIEINLKAGVYIIQDHREYVKDMMDKALMAMQSINHITQINTPIYFEDWMLERQYYNSKILEDAPNAMKNDEFELYIQPQFNIHTKEVIAGEALTRWKLENGELRMPDNFIPVFEENGMILTFDYYMLEKLCKQLRIWIDKGISVYPISINQSRLHIKEDNYLNDFCNIVDKYDIPHNYIAFELTESAFIEDSEKMLKLAKDLHRKGFQLAIDDFGTGYASINLLAEISADILKIDRVLLNDCNHNTRSQVVTEMIINLAHRLHMKVIAEGIETEEQLAFLRELNCDMGQGFLIGKPMESNQFMTSWNKEKKV